MQDVLKFRERMVIPTHMADFKQKSKCNERKTNVWSTNKFSKEMHTSVSVAFSVLSSVQSEMAKNDLIYCFTADPTERGGAKGQANKMDSL